MPIPRGMIIATEPRFHAEWKGVNTVRSWWAVVVYLQESAENALRWHHESIGTRREVARKTNALKHVVVNSCLNHVHLQQMPWFPTVVRIQGIMDIWCKCPVERIITTALVVGWFYPCRKILNPLKIIRISNVSRVTTSVEAHVPNACLDLHVCMGESTSVQAITIPAPSPCHFARCVPKNALAHGCILCDVQRAVHPIQAVCRAEHAPMTQGGVCRV